MRAYIIKRECDQEYIVYLPDSLRFFIANQTTVEVIQKILEGEKYTNLRKKYEKITKKDYTKIITALSSRAISDFDEIPDNALARLVLNITNSCNLGCKYCYANGGTYASENSLMKCETAVATLDTFYSIFDKIEVIQLFGGEPCLNIPVIRKVCEYIESKNKDTVIGIVTNGTIMSEELITLIKKYKILITLSLDHENIHDLLRPYKDGKESFERIILNMRRLYEITGQPSQVEVTYTKLHEDLGVSIAEVVSSVKNHIGNVSIHLVPVCSSDKAYKITDTTSFVNSISDYFEQKRKNGTAYNHTFIDDFLLPLREKTCFGMYCNAGEGTLSVSTNGTIYSCFFFTDNKEHKIANIYSDLKDVKRNILEKRKLYNKNAKIMNNKCKECFANTVCYNCLGVNYSENGDMYKMSENHCRMTKEGLVKTLEELAIPTQQLTLN